MREDAMSSLLSDDGEMITPSRTTSSIASSPRADPIHSTLSFGVCPWEGRTYIIRDPKTGLAIVLKDGHLGLRPEEEGYGNDIYNYGRGSHWHCVENDEMWLVFRNSVSGTYIGHNNEKKFVARAGKHREWEWFCVRQHPDGGHILLVRHWSGFRAMSVESATRELVVDENREGGTAWEFIRVYSE